MPSDFHETVTHHFAVVIDRCVNQGSNDPLIGMAFVAFCGTLSSVPVLFLRSPTTSSRPDSSVLITKALAREFRTCPES